MRPVISVDRNNKYRNSLSYDGKTVIDGQNGLESVELVQRGKRTLAILTFSSYELLSLEAGRCPDFSRYAEVRKARGNSALLSELDLQCDLIRVSPWACDGCPRNPDKR